VAYDLVNLAYIPNEKGKQLEKADSKAKELAQIRGAELYLRMNSFNPTRCSDIQQQFFPTLSKPVLEGLAKRNIPGLEIPLAIAK
jgi:hypothetical protein